MILQPMRRRGTGLESEMCLIPPIRCRREAFLGAFLGVFAIAFCPVVSPAQETGHPSHRVDTLTGTVSTDEGIPIQGAVVIATRAPDRMSFATETDEAGRYRLEIREGTGDYLVYFSAAGRQPARRRLTRATQDAELRLDVVLAPAGGAQTLATVVVGATRRVIARERGAESEPGASEESPPGVYGAIPPGLQGDLAALAATTQGVVPLAEGGFSVLGLDASQNSSTLNGMAFSASDIPREAKTRATVATSTYDPSRGWFSGAQVAITLQPGGVFSFRRSHLTMDPPAFQVPDRYAQSGGGRFTNVQLSAGGDGPLTDDDKYVYSYALQGSVRTEPVTSLWGSASDIARFTAIPVDSASSLLDRLSSAGVPIASPSGSTSRRTNNVSFIGRVDHAPYDWSTFTPSRTTFGLLAYGKLAASGASGVSPTTTAAYGGSTTAATGVLQALYSSYDSAGALTDFRSAITFSRAASTPYFLLPSASVLVQSTASEATVNGTVFHFGSDPRLGSRTNAWTWETSGDRQAFVGDAQQHRLKLSANVRIDGQSQETAADRHGRFEFVSLADLAGNTPSAFTRTTNAVIPTARVVNAFAAVGDYWQLTSKLNVMYGARLDANRFISGPPELPEVKQTFNVSTSHLANSVSLSPRLGFTWTRRGSGAGIRVSPVGLFSIGPSSYLRGGVGRFRAVVEPALTLGRGGQNTIGSRLELITCAGSAAPAPDWSAYLDDITRIPDDCLSGVSSELAGRGVDVAFLDPNYRPPSSWRGNLGYASQWSRLAFSVEGIYSINLDQPSHVDLNLRDAPVFRLAEESNRPVYVPPGAVDSRSGTVALGASREHADFGRVDALRSDSRSESRQLSLRLSPRLQTLGNWYASLGYTLSTARQLQRGHASSTFASPGDREWSPGDFVRRHQVLLQGGIGSARLSLTFLGLLASGSPFTPLISTDVNGDGRSNDRAFIFDPARVSDPALANGIQSLLAGERSHVRDCLARQLNAPAGHNSCHGPWSASLHAYVRASGNALRLGNRVNAALSISNPLGGLDQLLHGNRRLRGWGTPAAPDPILFRVRGFDTAAAAFLYDVNGEFGSTARSNVALRVPFRVTLDVSIDIGKPVPVQQIEKWLSPGRSGRPGPRLTEEEIKQRYRRNVRDPYAQILAQSDSLLLSRDQVDSLRSAQAGYNSRIDSIWTRLATYLSNLNDRFDGKEALQRAEAATDEAWEFTRADIQRALPNILDPIQLRLMPVAGLYNSRGPIAGRSYGF